MFVSGLNRYAVLLICMLLATSCKKDAPDFPTGSSEAINGWIYDQMEQYYYWSSALPPAANYNHLPKDFFHSLLVKEDRFSNMMPSGKTDTYGTTLLNTFGFDFMQFKEENATVSLISHVVPGSAGDRLGLQRGDTLQHVNGQLPTENRLSSWLQQATQQTSILLTLANGKTYTLPAAYISQPVIYPSEMFMADRDNRVGYLFLSHFDFSGGYDLLKAIVKLQANGVQELILDLRYNSGGSVAFASFVALALADIQPSDVFVHYKGNGRLQDLQETFAQTLARQPDGYSFSASDVRQKGLGLQRLLVLGTGHTASASEMLINNLRPYIEVVHIGGSTYGKDMASTTLTTPASVVGTVPGWHIVPMIYKIYNAQGQGEYANGLQPQQKKVEHSVLPLYPFGDQHDALVAEALVHLGYRKAQIKSDIKPSINAPTEPQLLFQSAPYQAQPIEIQTIKK
ncbi:peptidase S41 [Sphingobacterium gobiense]|uniref:Peptidase S41 n=1 Tax=Sphingobacterium gobiense TaxID=1382456 RepID=A0A2S9JS36_9SPHI|nr:peptidase S41 [Sphingobacterium gobiense]